MTWKFDVWEVECDRRNSIGIKCMTKSYTWATTGSATLKTTFEHSLAKWPYNHMHDAHARTHTHTLNMVNAKKSNYTPQQNYIL